MKLPIFFAAQFFIIILLIGTSIQSGQARIARHSVKQVLGARYLAQEVLPENLPLDQTIQPETVQPDQAPSNPDNNTSGATLYGPQETGSFQDQTQIAPDQTTSQSIQQPPEQPLQVDEVSIINQNPTPTEDQSAQITPSPSITSVEEQTRENQQETVDTALESNSSPENLPEINSKTAVEELEKIDVVAANKAEQEDRQLQEAKDPQQQTEALINFAKDKVVDINQKISGNDFSTVSFLIQRFSDQIDKAQDNLGQINIVAQAQVQKKLKTFCKQADLGLKTQQLIVPEDIEQDFEIARGLCLATQ